MRREMRRTHIDDGLRPIALVRSPPAGSRNSISETPKLEEGHSCMEDRLPRKLAAILYADVASYGRLTSHSTGKSRIKALSP